MYVNSNTTRIGLTLTLIYTSKCQTKRNMCSVLFFLTNTIIHETSGAEQLLASWGDLDACGRNSFSILKRGRTMRMLSDSPAVVDASTVPLLVTPASASPAGGSSHASFDANMVAILAALLCVLICALGLKSLIRCALHGGRTLAAPPAAAAVVIAATPGTDAGLEKRALRRIPVEVYESKAGVPDPECAICLGEFADGEKVRVLPRCHHGFHVPCIDMWLAAHSSCPICRNSLLEREAPARQMVDGEEAT